MVSIGPDVAKKCSRAAPLSADFAAANDEAVDILSILADRCTVHSPLLKAIGAKLGPCGPSGEARPVRSLLRFFGRIAGTCREMRRLMDKSELWPQLCQMRVSNARQLSESFSLFFFARYISLRRTHSHLTRRILVGLGGEPEAQLLSADRLTDVVVCETPDDEKTFWTKRQRAPH